MFNVWSTTTGTNENALTHLFQSMLHRHTLFLSLVISFYRLNKKLTCCIDMSNSFIGITHSIHYITPTHRGTHLETPTLVHCNLEDFYHIITIVRELIDA